LATNRKIRDMPRRRLPFPLSLATALTLGGGLAATAVIFVAVSHLEYDKMNLGFEQRAGIRIAAIRKGLDEAVQVVTVINQLFATVEPVTRRQFHDFTVPLQQRYPFITAFNVHRQVSDAERAGVEAELQQVRPGTVITELSGGTPMPAQHHARYNVVDFLEPLAGNEVALGLDVTSFRQIMATQARAVDSGRASATSVLALVNDPRPQAGFLVIMPVYRHNAALGSAAERRAALIGDTAAIIRPGELVRKILIGNELLADDGIELAVYANGADGQPLLVFPGAGAGPSAAPAPKAGHSFAARLGQWLALEPQPRLVSSLDVAGQPWRIEVAAAPRPFLGDHLASLLVLVGGALLTLLMSALVQAVVRRSRRVQRLVQERTADLELSNQRLIHDVIDRKRTEKALQQSEQRFRQLVSMSSDWYWEQDDQFRFVAITGGFGEKAGVASTRLLGKTRWATIPGMEDSEWGQAHIAENLAHQRFTDFEYATVDDDGGARWFSVNGEPLFDDTGRFTGYRGTGTDITARKLSEQRIHHVAQHDVLTGLPNRSLLQDRLSQAVAYSMRCAHPVWVMLIDLDRFKFVNDSMGHKAGDVLLMTVAARLRSALRDTDTVARLSGDEFVVILTEHEDESLSVDIVQRLMDSVAQPVMLGSKEFFVTCSIGVAVYPTDGAPADSLIEHADIAMYRAKKLGRNNFQFYTPAMNEEAMERVRIESALRNALERNEFVLHYQPQVDLASGEIVGMEALIRWQHPEMGMVAPSRFIGVAEETGLIVQIGAWVMRAACLQNQAWQQAGLGKLRVAVNLSARQFGAASLIEEIRDVLAETALPADSLEIELTESLFMSDVTLAVELLHGMKALGVNLSIDDFGTGYSSLSYLSRFPIDVLKIDRSFVAEITRDSNDAAIVASIIALAHNLKLAVIAEGVETEEQLDYLRRHGCDQMQGYYFSPPLPAAEFEQLLLQQRRLPLLAAMADDALA
jgi:diguanylate cyclase (GGDEF)-like protein/PAS domain S-box-containing protein